MSQRAPIASRIPNSLRIARRSIEIVTLMPGVGPVTVAAPQRQGAISAIAPCPRFLLITTLEPFLTLLTTWVCSSFTPNNWSVGKPSPGYLAVAKTRWTTAWMTNTRVSIADSLRSAKRAKTPLGGLPAKYSTTSTRCQLQKQPPGSGRDR